MTAASLPLTLAQLTEEFLQLAEGFIDMDPTDAGGLALIQDQLDRSAEDIRTKASSIAAVIREFEARAEVALAEANRITALPYLLPLASWWRRDVQLKRPPRLPPHLTHVAVDCGSYTLAQHQLEPGFHFSAAQYVSWIRAVGPAVQWAVLPDWPCEGASPTEVRQRQTATTSTAIDVLGQHLHAGWCWCPVLQGQHVDDYLRHAIDIAAWVYDLHQVYANRGQAETFRVCIGSLCRRNSVAEIRRIIGHVEQVLPGLRLHLFGVKLAVLQQTGYLPDTVVSIDSAAWSSRFGQHITVSSDEQRRTCRRCRLVVPRSWTGAPTRCPECGGQLGVTQREYGLLVALPRYRARLERSLLARGRSLDGSDESVPRARELLRQSRVSWAA